VKQDGEERAAAARGVIALGARPRSGFSIRVAVRHGVRDNRSSKRASYRMGTRTGSRLRHSVVTRTGVRLVACSPQVAPFGVQLDDRIQTVPHGRTITPDSEFNGAARRVAGRQESCRLFQIQGGSALGPHQLLKGRVAPEGLEVRVSVDPRQGLPLLMRLTKERDRLLLFVEQSGDAGSPISIVSSQIGTVQARQLLADPESLISLPPPGCKGAQNAEVIEIRLVFTGQLLGDQLSVIPPLQVTENPGQVGPVPAREGNLSWTALMVEEGPLTDGPRRLMVSVGPEFSDRAVRRHKRPSRVSID